MSFVYRSSETDSEAMGMVIRPGIDTL